MKKSKTHDNGKSQKKERSFTGGHPKSCAKGGQLAKETHGYRVQALRKNVWGRGVKKTRKIRGEIVLSREGEKDTQDIDQHQWYRSEKREVMKKDIVWAKKKHGKGGVV